MCASFAFVPFSSKVPRNTELHAKKDIVGDVRGGVLKTAALTIITSTILFPGNAFADEYGREVEAPTLFTGETVEICTKRGILGKCLDTAQRTAENDNDKAKAYFRDPEPSLKQKYAAAQLQALENGETSTTSIGSNSEGNQLIEKLKQQSLDNKEKNEKSVRAITFQNDSGASFGPFDQQVLILNADGESFTLLKGAQAMRLKKAGYIKDKRFVTQPTQETIDAAFDAPEEGGIGNIIGSIGKGIFGNGNEE